MGRGGLRTSRPQRGGGTARRARGQGRLFRQFRHPEHLAGSGGPAGLNKRVLEGGTHSINIRIVTPKDAPLVHANSLDIWLVQAGSATAVTGGELLDAKKRPNSDDVAGSAIKGGTEAPEARRRALRAARRAARLQGHRRLPGLSDPPRCEVGRDGLHRVGRP